jgi:hypothetical protein
MSVRNRAFQPTTNTTDDLVIGLMKMSVGASADYASAVAYNAGEDPDLASVGALKNSSVSMTPTFKEHQSGYPKILDFKIAELLEAMYTVEVEEINDSVVLGIIDDAIDSLETGTPKYYAIESLAEFATGGTLSLFSPFAQLKASLNFNFGDDFSSAPFEFEALANPAFTNQNLLYRTRVDAAARNTANQPLSKNVANLGIGMFQVRVGKPSRRLAGVASTTAPQKRVAGGATSTADPVGTVTGTYTGAVDGAFVLTCTNATGPVFSMVSPDGTATPTVTFVTDATPVVLTDGISLEFDVVADTGFAVGDVYVVGAYSADAQDNIITGIASEYSFLTSADSVGAIQSASLETNPTYKDHYSGYPKIKDLQILESSTVTIKSALEEINASTGVFTTGYATNLWDILFDASVSGSLYNVPVEIVAELVTGGTLSFWMPNCQITPEGDFTPGDEWASMPFALESQVQGALGTKRIYRQTLVQNV